MTKFNRRADTEEEQNTLEDLKEVESVRDHPIWSMNAKEIRQWVDNNVTDMASAKNLLGWLTVLVVMLVRGYFKRKK